MIDTAANSAAAPSNTANNATLLPIFLFLAMDALETRKFIFNVVSHKRMRHRLKATPFIKPMKLRLQEEEKRRRKTQIIKKL
jgi:hypothetical protein